MTKIGGLATGVTLSHYRSFPYQLIPDFNVSLPALQAGHFTIQRNLLQDKLLI